MEKTTVPSIQNRPHSPRYTPVLIGMLVAVVLLILLASFTLAEARNIRVTIPPYHQNPAILAKQIHLWKSENGKTYQRVEIFRSVPTYPRTFSFNDKRIRNGSRYCYKAIAVSQNGVNSYFSEESCLNVQ